MFTIEVDDDGYQLVGPNGEESGITDYGEPAQVEVDGKMHEVVVEDKDSAMGEDATQLYLLMDEIPNVEEVEFEIDDDEDEGEPAPA